MSLGQITGLAAFSHFHIADETKVDTWIKDSQKNGRCEAEKVSELTKMVGQMQALIRTMAAHLKVGARAARCALQRSLALPCRGRCLPRQLVAAFDNVSTHRAWMSHRPGWHSTAPMPHHLGRFITCRFMHWLLCCSIKRRMAETVTCSRALPSPEMPELSPRLPPAIWLRALQDTHRCHRH